MAKLSIYVPDDLLERSRELDPELKLSTVVQIALRARLEAQAHRPYAVPTPGQVRNRAMATAMVRERLADAYQAGYENGVSFASELPWEAFESLAALGWDLGRWWTSFGEGAYERQRGFAREEGERLDFDAILEEFVEDHPFLPRNEAGIPVGLPAEGFVDALRAVWTDAMENPSVSEFQATEDVE